MTPRVQAPPAPPFLPGQSRRLRSAWLSPKRRSGQVMDEDDLRQAQRFGNWMLISLDGAGKRATCICICGAIKKGKAASDAGRASPRCGPVGEVSVWRDRASEPSESWRLRPHRQASCRTDPYRRAQNLGVAEAARRFEGLPQRGSGGGLRRRRRTPISLIKGIRGRQTLTADDRDVGPRVKARGIQPQT